MSLSILSLFLVLFPFSSLAVDVVWVPSYNYNEKRLVHNKGPEIYTPTILVQHYTAASLPSTINTFQTNDTVSSHYTVAKNGTIYQHVDEKHRAWHAGAGQWGEVNDVNTYSIGIEIENFGYKENPDQPQGQKVNGSDLEWYPFEDAQIKSVIALSQEIIKRYKIEAKNVIGHADLACGRKEDPGPLFPWGRLAKEGVGAWVDIPKSKEAGKVNTTNVADVQKKLRQYGYTSVPQSGQYDDATKAGLVSFQMHFRQTNIDGKIDEETIAVLDALLEKYAKNDINGL